MKTEAVVFTGVEKFETRELTIDEPGDGEIAVRTLVTAISPGTERWILKGSHIGTVYPCVPGYHRIGRVEKCGRGVKQFREGDIVYGGANRWREKEVHSMWGAHCGWSVAPWRSYAGHFLAAAEPDRRELELAAFTIVAGVAHRGIRFLDIRDGETVFIIGAGFIGLCAAQFARLRGGVPVLVDTAPERVAFAAQLGLEARDAGAADFEARMKDFAPGGFDVIYDTAGVPSATDRAVGLARRWGRLLLQAQYFDRARCAIDLDQVKIKELTVRTTVGIDDADFDATLAEIRKRRLMIAPLITHRFQPGNFLEGYRMLLSGEPFNMGMVCNWDRPAGGSA